MAASHDPVDGRPMRCMEISGGSQAVEESIAFPGLDAWLISRPYHGDESGGDVHYLSLCGGGLITRMILADISGHGANAAALAVSLRAVMRKNINNKSQARLVRALNSEFATLAQMQRFATAIIGTYLASLRRLTLCNAGHPRPLLYRARTKSWEVLDRSDEASGNLPLGIDNESTYQQFAVVLEKDDLILLYTDAFIEAVDPSGRFLGEEGLLALARALDAGPPAEVGRALVAAVERHRADTPADDDVTLLVLRHTAAGPRRLSIGEKLDVYAKVFGMKAV